MTVLLFLLIKKPDTQFALAKRESINTSITCTDVFKCKTLKIFAEGLLQLLISYDKLRKKLNWMPLIILLCLR